MISKKHASALMLALILGGAQATAHAYYNTQCTGSVIYQFPGSKSSFDRSFGQSSGYIKSLSERRAKRAEKNDNDDKIERLLKQGATYAKRGHGPDCKTTGGH